jgi:hypothetical protein
MTNDALAYADAFNSRNDLSNTFNNRREKKYSTETGSNRDHMILYENNDNIVTR